MINTELSDAARRDLDELQELQDTWIARIERDTSDQARIAKASTQEWSLVEIMQHLALVSRSLLRGAKPLDSSAHDEAEVRFAALTAALQSSRRITAPIPQIVPRPGVTWDEVVHKLRSTLQDWRAFVDGSAFETTAFGHPLAGDLTASRSTRFLVEHARHHVPQLERELARVGQ